MTPADSAIARMRSPREMHIICVDVTNRCDLQCSNCTRLLAQQRKRWDMTLDNFRTALRSLADYPGVIAVIGGNPCLHPEFEALCRVFVEEIPEKRQRGLWSNNVFKHQQIVADTFGTFNLNPHGDKRGVASLEKLRALVPGLPYYEGHSTHAPLLTAIRDVIADEGAMWDAIAQCDINQNWSASIVQNNGQLRAYFCEVAASFDLAKGEDHGHPVVPGWWKRSISEFSDQVRHFCPGCGVAARLQGRLDIENTDDYTASNEALARNTRDTRKTVKLARAVQADHAVTDYTEAHRKAPPVVISVVIPCYNAAATLRETIASVQTQELPDGASVEVIVADDGSMDGSPTIANSIAGVRLLPARGNFGPAAARNRGLRRASGDFVCFLDADDTYAPGFFAMALRLFAENPQIAAVMTDVELVNAHRDVDDVRMQAIATSLPSNVMIRRAVVDVLGGFPEDPAFRGKGAGEDVAFKQVLSTAFNVAWVHHPFLRYRVTQGSHFDLFLDSTEVVGGALRFTSRPVEDEDGSRPAAARAYAAAVERRLAVLEATRRIAA